MMENEEKKSKKKVKILSVSRHERMMNRARMIFLSFYQRQIHRLLCRLSGTKKKKIEEEKTQTQTKEKAIHRAMLLCATP